MNGLSFLCYPVYRRIQFMNTMKAAVIYEPGGPEKLILEERPVPKTKPGWSLVKIRGFGINHSEIFTRNGLSPSVHFPRILGIECVGEIAETTDEKRLPVGQKVISIMGEMGRAFDGSYAEYALLPNSQLYPVHTDLPWDILAAIPETFYTAYGSFLNLRIHGNEEILVRGATSGVGLAFQKLVKGQFPDLHVTGSSRNEKKRKKLLNAGFDDVVIDQNGILQTDQKYDRILDLIGPSAIKDTFLHMKEGSIVCITGLLGGVWTIHEFDPIEELPANSYLTSFESKNVNEKKINEMLDYIEKYHIDAKPEKVFTLDQIQDAHRYLDSSESFGKVVVLP